jgi:hypothetical protein
MQNKTLAITRGCIPYYKELRQVAGSVTASILMQQLDYWFSKKNGEPFYKFKAPCENEYYKSGDSFTEELGFSIEEFTNAFAKIGFSYKSKTEFENATDKFQGMFYCSYFDRKEGLTFYFRNHELLDTKLNELFTVKQESPFTENGKVYLQKTAKSISSIYITEEYNNRLQQKKDTASGFSSQISCKENLDNSTNKENLSVQKQDGQQDYILNTSKKSGPTCRSTVTVKPCILDKNNATNGVDIEGPALDHPRRKNADFEEFWKEWCNMCKAKGSTAGEKKPAQTEYQKAVKFAGHQGIMRTLEAFKDYILLAFENNKHACRWLKNIHWPDFEEAINNYKQQAEVLKAEARKRGQILPVQQKNPKKQQEEGKMKEDTQKKVEAIKSRLDAKEKEFNDYIKKKVLGNYFSHLHFISWIDNMSIKCRDGVATVGVFKDINDYWSKLQPILARELQSKGFEFKKIEWKLID